MRYSIFFVLVSFLFSDGLSLCFSTALGKPVGYVPTANELKSITNFKCNNMGNIDNLTRLKHLTNAISIEMKHNHILSNKGLGDVYELPKLKHLDLSDNHLKVYLPTNDSTIETLNLSLNTFYTKGFYVGSATPPDDNASTDTNETADFMNMISSLTHVTDFPSYITATLLANGYYASNSSHLKNIKTLDVTSSGFYHPIPKNPTLTKFFGANNFIFGDFNITKPNFNYLRVSNNFLKDSQPILNGANLQNKNGLSLFKNDINISKIKPYITSKSASLGGFNKAKEKQTRVNHKITSAIISWYLLSDDNNTGMAICHIMNSLKKGTLKTGEQLVQEAKSLTKCAIGELK